MNTRHSIVDTILALEALVKEGALTWTEATLQLREEFGFNMLQCYLNGSIFKFQKADPAYQSLIIRPRSLA